MTKTRMSQSLESPPSRSTLAAKVLGVSSVTQSPARVREIVRRGIAVSKITRVGDMLGLSQTEMAGLLGLNAKTLTRLKQSRGRLGEKASDRLARLVRAFDRTVDVLGDASRARDWLVTTSPALGGDTPLEWLDTDAGTSEVLDLLGRIEHGVVS